MATAKSWIPWCLRFQHLQLLDLCGAECAGGESLGGLLTIEIRTRLSHRLDKNTALRTVLLQQFHASGYKLSI